MESMVQICGNLFGIIWLFLQLISGWQLRVEGKFAAWIVAYKGRRLAPELAHDMGLGAMWVGGLPKGLFVWPC